MRREILMPPVTPSMTDGKIARWHVAEGQSVAAGDLLVEVATPTATLEIEAEGEGRLGLTADLSEGGCTLLWPSPLPPGARLPLRLHACGRTIPLRGEVVVAHAARDGWHAHGVRFVDVSQADVDAIDDAVFQFVVPSLFERLSEPPWFERLRRRIATARAQRRAGVRRDQALPVRVTDADGTFVAVTRDTSEGGLGFVSPRRIPEGAVLTVEVCEPRGARTLPLVAARSRRLATGDAFPAWLVGARVHRAALIGRALPPDQAAAQATSDAA